ncbi:MAG TPA: PepSY-associated TM helix domain-containing protein [Sphingobacteriaceae bacterium]
MSNPLGKRIYKIHQWTGLLAGVVILIMGLSGAVLAFHDELEAFVHRGALTVVNSAPVDVDKALQTVNSRYQNWEVRLQEYSPDPSRTLVFSLRRPEERLTVFVHPSTGTILEQIDTNRTFVTWILTLHYSLHARVTGQVVILIAGICLLISILTGLFIYRKAILDVLLFRNRLKKKNNRAVASFLHRQIGVWALLLNLAMVLSGILISYDITSNAIKSGGRKKSLQTPELSFSVNRKLAEISRLYPGFHAASMRFPTAAGLPLRISGPVDGTGIFWSRNYNSVLIDSETGEIQAFKNRDNADTQTRVASISRSVHFLEFGNLPVKILFSLSALSAPALSVTGFLLWYWKKRRRTGTVR